METLQIIIYALLIILIIVAIIIGIRLIITLHKVDILLDDVTAKVKTLDKIFEIIDVFNNKMSALGSSVVGFISGAIKKIFKNKKIYSYDEEEEE